MAIRLSYAQDDINVEKPNHKKSGSGNNMYTRSPINQPNNRAKAKQPSMTMTKEINDDMKADQQNGSTSAMDFKVDSDNMYKRSPINQPDNAAKAKQPSVTATKMMT